MNSVIGRNILNCSFRYAIRIEEILNMRFQARDIYNHFHANEDNSVIVAFLIELLQCRDGYLRLLNDDFSSVDVTSMIDSLCTC